jgi:quercetin dioxygenase-like cupin family protein
MSGTLYYADGDTVDHGAEKAYGPGSVLAIHSGTKHWVSTRDTALEMLLVASPPAQLAPPVAKQLQR